jgi:hypothetical protein
MKKFTKEDIDGAREYFKEQGYPEVKVNLGNRCFSYFVMPQELCSSLPDFVYRCTGELADGFVFGISESVRPDFRQYAVAHEFIEFTEIGIDTKDRCVKALEEELKLVPSEIKNDYMIMRRDFFKNLIEYCSNEVEYTKEDINEFKQSLSRLEELVKQ